MPTVQFKVIVACKIELINCARKLLSLKKLFGIRNINKNQSLM